MDKLPDEVLFSYLFSSNFEVSTLLSMVSTRFKYLSKLGYGKDRINNKEYFLNKVEKVRCNSRRKYWLNNYDVPNRYSSKTSNTKVFYEDKYTRKKNGKYEEYWSPSRLKCRGYYVNGELNGLYERWYEYGHPRLRCSYRKGKLHGNYVTWDEYGRKLKDYNYNNGKLHGKYEEWDNGGRKTKDLIYKNGKLHGKCLYYDNCRTLERLYTNGVNTKDTYYF
ncbi:MORN-repeat protein [Orpheovirus IHUMI-LCC2]|uniref:MORN-repeat protein n=1 Tax=Orpheovirus IHUMI-LCC2 TaxID=2023057 RepID=A0A2I2L5M1_9VIRU|nr:MORN-repeat protein [Orpheovirus IHUMI-LCC2]SNW62816.1 MORN-repeat protein [Orpheovirus IHUMI-LCC2]